MTAPDRPARPPLAAVVLVTGKGGVGKTTVAAGLAAAAAARDGASVLVEFGDGEAGRRALGGRRHGVEHVVIKPDEAVVRCAAPLFGSSIVAKVVLGNFAVRRLVRAAPGLRELTMLEAVRLVSEERPPGRRVVVDMPATGHGVAWLRVPAQMRDMLATGALHELSARLARDLIAPGRCSVVIVTLPERLVLQETLELARAMRNDVGLPPSRLIVNRVPTALPEAARAQAQALVARGGKAGEAARALVDSVEARALARVDALDVLGEAVRSAGLSPVLLPDAPHDPSATDVAGWLREENAA